MQDSTKKKEYFKNTVSKIPFLKGLYKYKTNPRPIQWNHGIQVQVAIQKYTTNTLTYSFLVFQLLRIHIFFTCL